MIRLLTFLGRVTIWMLVIHAGYSAALALVMDQCYTHRMPNVREFDEYRWARLELVAAFLENAPRDDRPTVLCVGSSFTYGYPFAERVASPHEMQIQLPQYNVLNASVIGSGLGGVHECLLQAARLEERFDAVVVEIPVVNELGGLCGDASDQSRTDLSAGVDLIERPSYLNVFLRIPAGLGHFSVIWDEYEACFQEMDIVLQPLPEGYFATAEQFEAVAEVYRDRLVKTLEAAKRVGDEVYVFATPVYVGNPDAAFDYDAVQRQIEYTCDICDSVPNVHLIESPQEFGQTPAYFCNRTHLNVEGNREFGRLLAAGIEKQTQTSVESIARRPEEQPR